MRKVNINLILWLVKRGILKISRPRDYAKFYEEDNGMLPICPLFYLVSDSGVILDLDSRFWDPLVSF